MMQKALSQFPWPSLSSAALLLFFAFFVALLALVNMKSQESVYFRAARLPLHEGDSIQENEHAERE